MTEKEQRQSTEVDDLDVGEADAEHIHGGAMTGEELPSDPIPG